MTTANLTAVPKNWQALTYHPLAELCEFGAGMAQAALTQHMRDNGYDQREPLVLYQGMILDGRHRHPAAIEAGVVPSFVEFVGDDPLAYVVKKLLRQHLDASQIGMMIQRLKGEMTAAKSPLLRLTVSELCKAFNIGEKTLQSAGKVHREGTGTVQGAVMDGTLSVSDAAKIVNQPAAVQDAAVEDVRSGKAKTATAAVESRKPARGGGGSGVGVKPFKPSTVKCEFHKGRKDQPTDKCPQCLKLRADEDVKNRSASEPTSTPTEPDHAATADPDPPAPTETSTTPSGEATSEPVNGQPTHADTETPMPTHPRRTKGVVDDKKPLDVAHWRQRFGAMRRELDQFKNNDGYRFSTYDTAEKGMEQTDQALGRWMDEQAAKAIDQEQANLESPAGGEPVETEPAANDIPA